VILAGSPLFSTNIELIKKDKSERVYGWHRLKPLLPRRKQGRFCTRGLRGIAPQWTGKQEVISREG